MNIHLEPATAAETADTLRASADVIRTRGWAQGNLIRHSGTVCAVGAMIVARNSEIGFIITDVTAIRAIDHDTVFGSAVTTLCRFLAHDPEPFHGTIVGDGSGIEEWNDQDDMTEGIVVQAMEKAAAWCEEQGHA
jgi:hypothetical protein